MLSKAGSSKPTPRRASTPGNRRTVNPVLPASPSKQAQSSSSRDAAAESSSSAPSTPSASWRKKLPKQKQRLDIASQQMNHANCIVSTRDGGLLYSGGTDEKIRVWGADGDQVLCIESEQGTVWDLALSADESTLFSAGDRIIKVVRADFPFRCESGTGLKISAPSLCASCKCDSASANTPAANIRLCPNDAACFGRSGSCRSVLARAGCH